MEFTQEATSIMELEVQRLDGEFYYSTRAYLENRGCKWSEVRISYGSMSQLESIHVIFPPGTTYISLPGDLRFERFKITLPDEHSFYWNIERSTKDNEISVPFALLGA